MRYCCLAFMRGNITPCETQTKPWIVPITTPPAAVAPFRCWTPDTDPTLGRTPRPTGGCANEWLHRSCLNLVVLLGVDTISGRACESSCINATQTRFFLHAYMTHAETIHTCARVHVMRMCAHTFTLWCVYISWKVLSDLLSNYKKADKPRQVEISLPNRRPPFNRRPKNPVTVSQQTPSHP